jgi:hypothetical protein
LVLRPAVCAATIAISAKEETRSGEGHLAGILIIVPAKDQGKDLPGRRAAVGKVLRQRNGGTEGGIVCLSYVVDGISGLRLPPTRVPMVTDEIRCQYCSWIEDKTGRRIVRNGRGVIDDFGL